MSEFLQMGGYGVYVWSAFGFAAVVLGGLLAQSVVQARRREKEFAQLREVARPAAERPARRPKTAVRARPVATASEAGER
ncbi:MAG: heme exporter protein CcmD [Geminicoccaceae bacterium]|nr:heme exporter protein CcmD [Geminicoccaceae bacterium]